MTGGTSRAGAITLEQIARHADKLDVRCSRCTRAGRLSVVRLIASHGPGASIGDATADLTADCPNLNGPVYTRCDVFIPELRTWFMR